MDPVGLAQAVLALAVFPGGALLAAVAGLAARAGHGPVSAALGAREVAALVLVDAAVALAPLPGSPVASLPPGVGASPDLAIAAILLTAAVTVARAGWTGRQALGAGAAVVSAAALAAGAASLSLPAIVAAPGTAMLAARAAAAVALLVAGGAAVAGSELPLRSRAALLAGIGLLACALPAPVPAKTWQAAVTSAIIAVAALLYASAALWLAPRLQRMALLPGVAAAVCCAATIAAAAVASHV